jgi:hypothetical protein
MTLPLRHGIYPCSFDTTTINDVRSVAYNSGVTNMIATPGGSVNAALIAANYADPKITFTTGDIQTCLSTCTLTNGQSVAAGAWEVQYQKRTNGGVFTGSTAHVTLNGTDGFLYWTSISASQDAADGAEGTLELIPLSGGASPGYTSPVAENVSQSLAGSPAINSRLALGPVYANGTAIAGVTKVTINSGIKAESGSRASGAIFQTQVSITDRKPTIEIEVLNPAMISTLDSIISAFSGTGVVVYLQKVAATGGGRVAFATAEHVSFSASTGAWNVTGQNVSGMGDVTTTISAQIVGTVTQALATAIS